MGQFSRRLFNDFSEHSGTYNYVLTLEVKFEKIFFEKQLGYILFHPHRAIQKVYSLYLLVIRGNAVAVDKL